MHKFQWHTSTMNDANEAKIKRCLIVFVRIQNEFINGKTTGEECQLYYTLSMKTFHDYWIALMSQCWMLFILGITIIANEINGRFHNKRNHEYYEF